MEDLSNPVDSYWKVVAAPGTTAQEENFGTNINLTIMDKNFAHNFLNWNTTYWYKDELTNTIESDIVCSRTFRSLNNRILAAQEQLSRLSDKVAFKIQALQSYSDFISSLYNATQAQC